jgi:hypothetical protein
MVNNRQNLRITTIYFSLPVRSQLISSYLAKAQKNDATLLQDILQYIIKIGFIGENAKASEAYFVKALSGSFCESTFVPKNAEAMTSIVTERKSLKYFRNLTWRKKSKLLQFCRADSLLTFELFCTVDLFFEV